MVFSGCENGDVTNIENDNEQTNTQKDNEPLNRCDLRIWNNININLSDLIVEKGPIKISKFHFPKVQHLRSFSTSLYMQKYQMEKIQTNMVSLFHRCREFFVFVVNYLMWIHLHVN